MADEYTERQCPHNRCSNHNPQFENQKEEIADFKPSRLFKILIYFRYFCCKKKMKVRLVNDVVICRLCGRKKSEPFQYVFICECCGFHTKISKNKQVRILEKIGWTPVFVISVVMCVLFFVLAIVSQTPGLIFVVLASVVLSVISASRVFTMDYYTD